MFVDEEVLPRSPARIKGAGTKRRARELRVLTADELAAIAEAIPARYSGWPGPMSSPKSARSIPRID